MSNSPTTYDAAEVKAAAIGRMPEILARLGVADDVLDGKNHPCPKCGGDDRFYLFSDFEQTGGCGCRKCPINNADIFATVQWLTGGTFPEAVAKVAEIIGLRGTPSTRPAPSNGKPNKPSRNPKAFSSMEAALEVLDSIVARQLKGQRVKVWEWEHADGKRLVGAIVRYDLPTPDGEKQKKTIRPLRCEDGQWFIGGMAEPWQLYRLPEVMTADRVFITEGEKAADAVRSIGLKATTAPHGAKIPHKADWSPLAGKECVILPDNDADGESNTEAVTELLHNLKPTPTVRVLRLTGLPEAGDFADWSELHMDAQMPEDVKAALERLADAATIEQPEQPKQPNVYQPFPVNALPEPVRSFVADGAKAIGCDASYIVLPMLSVLAAAIGSTRRIAIKANWKPPAILWTAIVGESGTSKTPAFQLVMAPLQKLQSDALELHEEDIKHYETENACYERSFSSWKSNKKTTEPPPEKPVEPEPTRYYVSDTTVEALAPILQANPHGVLLCRDELAGWLGSFDRYAGGKTDASNWLSLFNGQAITVDRKTGRPPFVHVPHGYVSVTGGIQPAILREMLGSEHRESGMAARLLFAAPPPKRKRWTEAEVSQERIDAIERLLRRLYDLEPSHDDNGNEQPIDYTLTADAKTVWVNYYNRHADEQAELQGDLAAAWSKLEECPARLALVVHCIRVATNDESLADENAVDAASVTAGITMAEWFKQEAKRLYGVLDESLDERNRRKLAEWIQRKGGSVTGREVQQGIRSIKTAADAEKALTELVTDGFGKWEVQPPGKSGGRPSQCFVLFSTC